MVEIEKQALIQNTGYKYKQKKAGILTMLLNMTTRVTYEKCAILLVPDKHSPPYNKYKRVSLTILYNA